MGAGDSACSRGPTGVSSHEDKSCTGDTIGGVHGVRLGGIGVRRGDDTTSTTSLVSSAGTGSTGSAQDVGVAAGGPRGVVSVEVLPSTCTDFVAKGEGTNEFSCPLASKRGGTEIQSLSISFGVFGVMIG